MGQALYLTGTVSQPFHYELKFSDLSVAIKPGSSTMKGIFQILVQLDMSVP